MAKNSRSGNSENGLSKKEALFQSVQSYARLKNISKANSELKKLLKLGPFSAQEKHQLSLFYSAIGDNDAALRFVSPELSTDLLLHAPFEMLANQFRLSFLLYIMGARHAAARQEEQLERVFKSRSINFKIRYSHYYLFKGMMLRVGCKPDEADKVLNEGLKIYSAPAQRFLYLYTVLNWADNCLGSLRYKAARERLQEEIGKLTDDEIQIKVVFLRSLGEGYFIEGNYKEALNNFFQAAKFIDMDFPFLETAVLHRAIGQAYIGLEMWDKAREHLHKSYAMILHNKHNPNMGISATCMLERIPHIKISLKQKIVGRCYPSFSLFSLLLGRTHIASKHGEISDYFKKLIPSSQSFGAKEGEIFDSWLIQSSDNNEEIRPVSYGNYFAELYVDNLKMREGIKYYDLRSGCIFFNGQVTGHLPLLQQRALLMAVSAGELGIPEAQMLDFVYQEGLYMPEVTRERLKVILRELKKHGHAIQRKKNYYFYQNYENKAFIIPMERDSLSMHWPFYWKRKSHDLFFERKDVDAFYSIHKVTSFRWINEWIENKLVLKTGQRYCFKNAMETGKNP